MRRLPLVMITADWILGLAVLTAISMAAGAETSAMSPAQALARLMTGNERFRTTSSGIQILIPRGAKRSSADNRRSRSSCRVRIRAWRRS